MTELIDIQKIGRKIPTKQKAAYGLIYGANNIVSVARGMYIFSYLIDRFGLKLELYLLGNLLFFAYNALNNVIFSIYADKPRFKLGRRIPYIRYASLFLIITNTMIWFPWPGTFPGEPNSGEIMKFVQYIVYLYAEDTVSTILYISIYAWLPEATESETERAKMSIILRIATAIGGLSIIFLPFMWIAGLEVYRIFMLICASLNALCLFVGSFILKERPELYKTTYKNASMKDILKQLFLLYKKKAFLSYAIFVFSTTMMMQFNNNYPVLIGYGLGFAVGGEYIVTFLFYSSSYGMLPIYSRLVKSRPVDKIIKAVVKWGLILSSSFFVLMLITNLPLFLFPILIIGGAMLMAGLYGPLIMGNAIDQEELETGERREAMYSGASALITIPMNEIVGSIVAVGLMLINFQEGLGYAQEPQVLLGVRILNFGIIFIAALIMLLSIKLYPFKGETLVKLKNDIIELHAKKEA